MKILEGRVYIDIDRPVIPNTGFELQEGKK